VTRTTIAAASRAYEVALDDEPRRADRFQSVVLARLVDELNDRPIRGAVRVTTELRGATPKAATGGIGGVAGTPTRLFPGLDAQPYALDVRFEAAGFVPLVLSDVPVPQQPGFPGEFADVDLGEVALHRRPVVLIVRTLELDAQQRPVPLPGATVGVTGIWRRVGDLAGAPSAASMVALRPPLSAARPQPGTTVEPVAMTLVVEPERRLTRPAEPGSRELGVSRTGALAPGAVVGVSRSDPDRVEHVEVVDVVGPADPESPAVFVLAFPVHHRHPERAVVTEVTPGGVGPTAGLADDGASGDVTVFVSSAAPFGSGPVVRITGGAAPDEFASAAAYEVITDGHGYGRLPPLGRVVAIEVEASAAGPLSAPPTRFTVQHGRFENHLHLVLT
jgi:hypothetical protein